MTAPSISTVIRHRSEDSKFEVTAKVEVNGDEFREMSVQFGNWNGQPAADVFFTVDPDTGEPLIYVSTDGDPDEHRFAIRPMQPADKAVIRL